MALVFEDGAEFGVVEEAAFDGGLEDEPGALELADLAVGAADGEGLVEWDDEFRVALAKDLEHLDDARGVEFLVAGVDPQEHAGDVALVAFAVVLVGEQGVEVFLCLVESAIVEEFGGEFEMFGAVRLVGVLALDAWPEDLKIAGLADAHAAAIDGVVDDAGEDAVFARGVGDEFVVDLVEVAGCEVEANLGPLGLDSLVVASQRAGDEQRAGRDVFFVDEVFSLAPAAGVVVEGDVCAEALAEFERGDRGAAVGCERHFAVSELVVVVDLSGRNAGSRASLGL